MNVGPCGGILAGLAWRWWHRSTGRHTGVKRRVIRPRHRRRREDVTGWESRDPGD